MQTKHTNNAGSAITDLIILRLGQLDEQFSNLMFNIHHLENGRTVVGDCHITIGGDHDLVETLWTERGAEGLRDTETSQDVAL